MDSVKLKEEQLKLSRDLYMKGQKDFAEELRVKADKSDTQGLEFTLKELAKHNQAIISTKNSDEKLKKAKDVVSSLGAPYREQLSQNKLKSRYIGLLLQELNGFEDQYGEAEET